MIWSGKDRRLEIRRESDRNVCPYHDLKFDQVDGNLSCNNIDIKDIKKNMVTKDDLKSMDEKIEKKAPRWVVVTMVTAAVPIIIALMLWIGSRLDVISTVKANQDIMMKAFNIEVVPRDFDVKDK